MTKRTYRVLRILEYIGTRQFVDYAIADGQVKGIKRIPVLEGEIREAVLGETAELIGEIPGKEVE